MPRARSILPANPVDVTFRRAPAHVEKSVERTQRTVIRLSFGILLGIVLLIAAVWGGHDLYQRWREKRLVRRAWNDIEQGDQRDASLAARAILEMNPTSAAAARIMA